METKTINLTAEKLQFIIRKRDQIKTMVTNISDEVATFIACQFALESAFGTSRYAIEFHNFCGMKKAYVRPTTRDWDANSDCAFATYANDDLCLIDFFLCLSYRLVGTREFSKVSYYCKSIKWYCPEMDYFNRINTIYQSFKLQNHE